MAGGGNGGTLSARGSRAARVLESAQRRAQRGECRARSVLRRGRGRGAGGRGGGGYGVPPHLPPPTPPTTISGNAADVVQTAIESLGTPYIWGGTADNGFDCSGLIQYAYGQHGIRLPRMSRDQAHAGAEVPPVVDALRPGDILLLSARPGAGVTHVGMYVGELKFIHSSNRGVKLSRLDPQDPEGAYWLDRWVGARRRAPSPGFMGGWRILAPGWSWRRCRRRSTPWAPQRRTTPARS